MNDTWEFDIEVYPSERVGWRWWVRARLNGRRDPSEPEGVPWTLTYASALRKARRKQAQRFAEKAVGRFDRGGTLESGWNLCHNATGNDLEVERQP